LLAQLATQARLGQLVGFEEAAGQIPQAGIRRARTAAEQQAPSLDDDGRVGRYGIRVVCPAAAGAAATPMPSLGDGAQPGPARQAKPRPHERGTSTASRSRSAIARRARAAGASGEVAT